MESLTIGHLSKETGVNIETIRFYEREGLIETPARSAAGYRQYSMDAVRRVQFIRRAKDLGFTLKEVAGLLALQAKPGVSCADVREQAQHKIEDIRERITTLQRMHTALEKLVNECSGQGPITKCPILDAMDPDGRERSP